MVSRNSNFKFQDLSNGVNQSYVAQLLQKKGSHVIATGQFRTGIVRIFQNIWPIFNIETSPRTLSI